MLKAAQNLTIACRLVPIMIAPTAARRCTSKVLPFSEALFRNVSKTNVSFSHVLQYPRSFEESPLLDS